MARKEYAGGPVARYLLLGSAVFLTVFGLVMIYSASSISAYVKEGSATHFFFRQLVFVGLGTGQERDAALTLMRNSEAVFVADSTALAELARLEVGHALGALPKVLVSTATKEIVDALAADAETDDSFGSAFDAGGQLGFVEFDDRRKKQRLAFARTLSDIVGRCEVAPAYGDLGDSENARGMAKVMGPEEREMLLLAKVLIYLVQILD